MDTIRKPHRTLYILLIYVAYTHVQCAVRDLTDTNPTLYRSARDDRYYLNRYGSSQSTTSRSLKPEDRAEARTTEPGSNVEKRCSRCTGYNDPYYDHRVQDRAYDDRDRYYDRYYDNRYDDRYDYRGYDKDRYDRYDNRPLDRDRWYDRRYDDRYDYRGYDRDRYDRYDNKGAGYDNRGYDTRGYDYRGTGYDNRGYDYRKYDTRAYRPWDDTSRGSWDTGRGSYGRPDWGTGYDRGYASGWNYGGGRDGYRDQWSTGGAYRPRDPYNYDQGYRSTSYLYDRNTPNTTVRPVSKSADSGGTDRTVQPKMDKSSSNSG